MKPILLFMTLLLGSTLSIAQENGYKNENFEIKSVSITHKAELGITVWEMSVAGNAGETTPEMVGQLDGAHVLGYVFPTNLSPEDVGFNRTAGIVALALTSHPDFDDTPLWDENRDNIFDNDGVIWHPHWVILHDDKRVAGGLSVKEFKKADNTVVLPPTNPGMPIYMDSPGYPVTAKGKVIRVVVPDFNINNRTDFRYDGVTAFMKVNTSKSDLPMLGVYEVFSIASGNLSLPYKVK